MPRIETGKSETSTLAPIICNVTACILTTRHHTLFMPYKFWLLRFWKFTLPISYWLLVPQQECENWCLAPPTPSASTNPCTTDCHMTVLELCKQESVTEFNPVKVWGFCSLYSHSISKVWDTTINFAHVLFEVGHLSSDLESCNNFVGSLPGLPVLVHAAKEVDQIGDSARFNWILLA